MQDCEQIFEFAPIRYGAPPILRPPLIVRGMSIDEVVAMGWPVELPTKLELAINAKTAQPLGLTIPPSIMVRAEEVIE
jgi:hypothetical protein